MTLRQLLNAAYAALAYGREPDELAALDAELEADPATLARGRNRRPAGRGNLKALMAAAKMPQAGAPHPRPATEGGTS